MRSLIAAIFLCSVWGCHPAFAESGRASWYCKGFSGNTAASGEIYNCDALTTAHMDLPFGTMLHVTNPRNGKSVTVCVNDRGGFAKLGRKLDMSRAAFKAIAPLGQGVVKVAFKHVGKKPRCN